MVLHKGGLRETLKIMQGPEVKKVVIKERSNSADILELLRRAEDASEGRLPDLTSDNLEQVKQALLEMAVKEVEVEEKPGKVYFGTSGQEVMYAVVEKNPDGLVQKMDIYDMTDELIRSIENVDGKDNTQMLIDAVNQVSVDTVSYRLLVDLGILAKEEQKVEEPGAEEPGMEPEPGAEAAASTTDALAPEPAPVESKKENKDAKKLKETEGEVDVNQNPKKEGEVKIDGNPAKADAVEQEVKSSDAPVSQGKIGGEPAPELKKDANLSKDNVAVVDPAVIVTDEKPDEVKQKEGALAVDQNNAKASNPPEVKVVAGDKLGEAKKECKCGKGEKCECKESIKENFGSKAEFIEYLKFTLIPDLKASGKVETAKDFEEAIRWMGGTNESKVNEGGTDALMSLKPTIVNTITGAGYDITSFNIGAEEGGLITLGIEAKRRPVLTATESKVPDNASTSEPDALIKDLLEKHGLVKETVEEIMDLKPIMMDTIANAGYEIKGYEVSKDDKELVTMSVTINKLEPVVGEAPAEEPVIVPAEEPIAEPEKEEAIIELPLESVKNTKK